MVAALLDEAADESKAVGPVWLLHAPSAEIAEPFKTALDHALGVERQVCTHDLSLVLQE